MPNTLELRDLIDQVVQVARERDDSARVALGERLLEQLDRAVLTIVFAGQYSRGKTTLINALIGTDILPMGILPVTMVSTVVARGSTTAAYVVHVDGRREEIALEEVARTIVAPASRGLGIRRVEVRLPTFPFAGVELVDAPGIGTPADPLGRGAAEALQLADLAVLVVGPEPPITASELDFAALVRAASERLFVVVNKADLAGEDLRQVVEFSQDRLRERLGIVPPLYALDSRTALCAKGTVDPHFARFAGDLEAFVRRHGTRALAVSMGRRAASLADELADAVAIERAALASPRSVRRAAVERLRALDVDLRERRDELESGFARAVTAEFGAFEARIDQDISASRSAIGRRVEAAAKTGDADALGNALDAELRPVRERWRNEAETSLRQLASVRLRRLFAGLAVVREEVIATMRQAFSEPLELRAAVPPPEVQLPALNVVEDFPTTGLELALRGAFRALPRTARAARLRATLEERIERLLDRERGRLLAAQREASAALVASTRIALDRWSELAFSAIAVALDRAAAVEDFDVVTRISKLSVSENSLRTDADLLRSEVA
jgi:hypothetical protein